MKNVVPYYQRKKALIKAKQRQTKLTTVGGVVLHGLKKRPHPGRCELCGQMWNKKNKDIKLDYHHWIPEHPAIGLWLCNQCHHIAEFLDRDDFCATDLRYQSLKRIAKEQYHEKG